MTIFPLKSADLRLSCDPKQFKFKTTATLKPSNGIVGQPRGVRAIEFGIGMKNAGYNIYVLGETGTGRITTLRRFLEEKSRNLPSPWDWVYVHNFSTPHQPRAIEFPAGHGAQFKRQMEQFVSNLREEIPKAFATEAYEDEVATIWSRVELKQSLLMREAERKAKTKGFSIVKTAAGLSPAPIVNGELMTEEQYAALSSEEQERIDNVQLEIEGQIEEMLKVLRQVREDARNQLNALDKQVAERAITPHEQVLTEMYRDHPEVLTYLAEVHEDVLHSLHDFRPNPEQPTVQPDLRRYDLNLFVDNGPTEGAPVIIETNPTYNQLMGRIEYELREGMMSTHFTNIKPGSLHKANGGYLVLEAADLLTEPFAWEALKRSIKGGEIVLQPHHTLDTGGNVLAKSIDPENIPLNVKVILMGSPSLYYALFEHEEDFNELFKVKADFSTTMKRDAEHELEYARFIAARCHEERLLHFDRSAVARVVEYGAELAEHRSKLSTRFSEITDLIREAVFWAEAKHRKIVTATDVQYALDERVFRSNKLETLMDEELLEETMMITVEGEEIGQINALTVIDMGDYAFGRPSRITSRTYMGSTGVVHIERELDMADPIHNKGVLTMVGYLGGHYAQHFPLSLSASLTFEQNYGNIGGDSASSAELYALLSSLSELPIKQGVAVTGSINQHGQIQPIGGVNEKIEGFFRVCKMQGLTGQQGVIIPASNRQDLMLHTDVVAAVSAEQFHIWAINHVDEGIDLLFGLPAGKRNEEDEYPLESVHGRVEIKLAHFAKKSQVEEDEEEEEEPTESAEPSAPASPATRRKGKGRLKNRHRALF